MNSLNFLKKHKERFEGEVDRYLLGLREKTKLTEACEYIISSGGKRFRPIIVILIAEALGKGYNVFPSALAVEFFHTASLIADDLPCMDNEIERRSKPALHLAFNESVALLASYTFISSGYEMLAKNTHLLIEEHGIERSCANELCVLALREISKVAGISGATGGQFLDLFPPDSSTETIFKIIKLKTASLFEIAFVLGWLFGGGEIDKTEEIKKVAYHFGLAFQIADDIIDYEQDKKEGKKMNIALSLGAKEAALFFKNEIKDFEKKMKQLKILTTSFQNICLLLRKSVAINAPKPPKRLL
jgi:geranylgeranyl diphosphate synthase, type II